MQQLLILSGKGGTGKTTTAAAFIAFAKAQAFADCDVDAPNLHLVMPMANSVMEKPFLGSQKAEIDIDRCDGCGRCQLNCRFDAISSPQGFYKIDPLVCEGCGVCFAVCSMGAVRMRDDIAGQLMLYHGESVFSTAKLKMGRGNSGKLVTEVKRSMKESVYNLPLAIIDGSPGIGCPVIASISGVDMVLVVTEPSLSGISDLKRILHTCSLLGTKAAVCVNKYDICLENTALIEQFCAKENIEYVGTIPYDVHIVQAINAGENVANLECPASAALRKIYQKVMDLMRSEVK